jgi:ABC-type nitrate/sulfonate/bicarbonate transport system substrate-binding protein
MTLARRVMTLLGGLVAVGVLAVAPACAEKVRVTYPNLNGAYIFLFTAIDKGYYAQEGIEIELLESGGGTATPALVSGDVQFSTSGSSAISAIMKGARLKVLLVGQDRPNWQVWATRSDIKTFQDLRGQQVGIISRGDTGEIGLRYILLKRGLPQDFVAFTPFGSNVGARMAIVNAGMLAAGVLHPTDVEIMRGRGMLRDGRLLADMAAEVRSTFNGLAASDALIRTKPDLVQRFVKATLKGMIYARTLREASIARFANFMKTSPEAVATEYDQLRDLMAPDSMIPRDAQETEIALRGEMMNVAPDKRPAPATVFDFGFAERAGADLAKEAWTPQP